MSDDLRDEGLAPGGAGEHDGGEDARRRDNDGHAQRQDEPTPPPAAAPRGVQARGEDVPLSAADVGSRRTTDNTDFPARRRSDEPEHKERAVRRAIRDELAYDAPAVPGRRSRGTGNPADSPVIALQNVNLGFDRPILEDVSFEAFKGETVCVVGESGTGKSTTLKLILRLLVADRGRVLIENQDISELSFNEALRTRQRMGMVFQGAALFDSMSVFENVAYPLREHTELTEAEIDTRVREKLAFVDLEPDEVVGKLPSELSGGMRKRVGIARGMANNPDVMLYDEPTSGLDPLTTGTITRLIMKLQRELGVTSVVVSHDIRSVFRMATYVALLADRHIKFFGTPEEMTASDDRYIRDFLGGF